MGQTKEQRIIKQVVGTPTVQKRTPIATDMFVPNHSGDHSAGRVQRTPSNDSDIANKKYVDDSISAIPGGVDWTIDQSPLQINAANYVDNDTTYVSSDFDHNSLTNTHNLTTDIDHDQLTNFVANEHIDWTQDQGATNIHSGNIPDLSGTYAVASLGVTNGNSHDHNGGDGGQINHTNLSNIGTNTHAQIDTAITNSTNHIADSSDPHGTTLTQTLTVGNIAISLTAGEDLTAGDVVYIFSSNTVKKVTGSMQTILGVAAANASSSSSVSIIILGKISVTCSGTVAVGDLLIGAATGKVAKFTPTSSKYCNEVSAHSHSITDGTVGITSNYTTNTGGGHTPSFSSISGEFSGGKIIGKALENGTNTTIAAFINCMG